MNNLEEDKVNQEDGGMEVSEATVSLTEEDKIIVIKEGATPSVVSPTVLYFLNTCGIICDNLTELNGSIVPRETLLNDSIYDKLKPDIPKLKQILSSTTYTSMQKDADKTQQWPLINLIRQILRKYNYQFVPKRVCDGYTKDGIKKYKRFFEVRGLSASLNSYKPHEV